MGAAYIAALQSGLISSLTEAGERWELQLRFEPELDAERREQLSRGWHNAVECVRGFKPN